MAEEHEYRSPQPTATQPPTGSPVPASRPQQPNRLPGPTWGWFLAIVVAVFLGNILSLWAFSKLAEHEARQRLDQLPQQIEQLFRH